MPDDTSPLAPQVDARDLRAHTHALPASWIGRMGLVAQNWLESAVARASLHGDPCVYDTREFPWIAELEAGWRGVREELDAVLTRRSEIPSFQSILKEVGTINTDEDWKTFWLVGMGMDCSRNAATCPRTMALLARVPDLANAFFSILSPGKHIPAHRGAYNGLLRLHLALQVPEPREQCRIRIGHEMRTWREGEALVFDDSFNHEVWNETDGVRVVLFVDFVRPLKRPWHALNRRFIRAGALAPFMREAGRKHREWERRFYRKG
ncbi:MAG TPA: aspartyl/asparaginyl beta-hydroxylase domain-containing protein [Nevskiaceae bacterium]|nr:aspartyl/asparaginyl beta-hydroxylase domain-containing protein [Nevskiaceae bacterium]